MLDVLVSTVSSIEWCDATWNPVRGCSKVSAGCTNCYAMKQAHRFSGSGKPYEGLTKVVPGKGPQWTGDVRTVPGVLEDPLRWRAPRRVFVNSMSDLFHEGVPFDFIDRVFSIMALAPRHTFQILTKRPDRMAAYMSSVSSTLDHDRGDVVADIAAGSGRVIWDGRGSDPSKYPHYRATHRLNDRRAWVWPLPNVWLGTSVEDQAAADERIPHLLRTPAAVRFLSCEPLLGPVDLTRIGVYRGRFSVEPLSALEEIVGHVERPRIDWVIAGGESGPGARPCNVEWIRSLVAQCRAAGVAPFVKQMGRWISGTTGDFGETGFRMLDRWLLEGGSIFVPPLIGDRVYARPDNAIAFSIGLKGEDPRWWPEDLRVREFPETSFERKPGEFNWFPPSLPVRGG